MVRLLILSCVLLSYFANIMTLSTNDEVKVGFRDLFNTALPEKIDSDQTSVVYRRPRYAGCLKCKFVSLPPREPHQKAVAKPPPHIAASPVRPCSRCGQVIKPVENIFHQPQSAPLHKPSCSTCGKFEPDPLKRKHCLGCGQAIPESRMFPHIKALANRVSNTILKWLKGKKSE